MESFLLKTQLIDFHFMFVPRLLSCLLHGGSRWRLWTRHVETNKQKLHWMIPLLYWSRTINGVKTPPSSHSSSSHTMVFFYSFLDSMDWSQSKSWSPGGLWAQWLAAFTGPKTAADRSDLHNKTRDLCQRRCWFHQKVPLQPEQRPKEVLAVHWVEVKSFRCQNEAPVAASRGWIRCSLVPPQHTSRKKQTFHRFSSTPWGARPLVDCLGNA